MKNFDTLEPNVVVPLADTRGNPRLYVGIPAPTGVIDQVPTPLQHC